MGHSGQKGFSVIIVLFLLLVLVAVGVGGWYRYRQTEIPEVKQEVPEATSSDATAGWKTYMNTRFRFAIDYPSSWLEGQESDNGDGKPLYDTQDNRILAYGSNFPPTSPSYVTVERSNLKLNSGKNAEVLKFKDGNKMHYIVFFSLKKGGTSYTLYAIVTEGFFNKNKDTIQSVAKTLRLLYGNISNM